MSSLVVELQREALDRSVPVSDLLRKAKVVATKLDLREFLAWIEHELEGDFGEEGPKYRVVKGSVRALNPYQGWVPVLFTSDPDVESALTKRRINNPIAELESLDARTSSPNGSLKMSLSSHQHELLWQSLDEEPTEIAVFFDKSRISGILDAVRNQVLDWSLKLETAGILGEDMSFSEREKNIAHTSTVNFHINHIGKLTGNLGPVSDHSSVTANQFTTGDLDGLRRLMPRIHRLLPDLAEEGVDVDQLRATVAEVESELSAPEPNRARLRTVLGSLGRMLEGIPGGIIASGIYEQLSGLGWFGS